ncbi:MAG: type II secretion system protein GspE [Actinobacteria bacterium]|nr:type II secretion system protein GspE [Actinomycetota bacterium]
MVSMPAWRPGRRHAATPAQPAAAAAGAIPGLTPASGNSDPRRRLGDVIVELGYADRELVEQLMAKEAASNRPMGELLLAGGMVSSKQLAHALAERNGFYFVDLKQFHVEPAAANLIGAGDARRYRAIPIAFLQDGSLLVATSDPANILGVDDIAMSIGYPVRRAIASQEGLDAVMKQLSVLSESVEEISEGGLEQVSSEEAAASADQAPVVKLVHSVIADAVNRGASDIHFDATGGDMRVRMRVDGVVLATTTVPARLVRGLVSRIKIMAGLDIAERRVPQDGRIALNVDGRQVDIRVSTLPVIRGESVVMRILDRDRVVLDLDQLGMLADDRKLVRRAIGQVHGAVVVTGPTGAGKTSTLYALLTEINTPDRTVIAIEDPVEYEVEGIQQIHVNPKAGLTFASGLRSMLRSDSDTLMVGEIRDRDTAQIAMEAALTGHLVLTTLHTNEASIAPARLVEMGIEPFLVASGIECVVAQRLARRLCEECKRPVTLSPGEVTGAGGPAASESFQAFEPVGCVQCNGTGYRGRIGLYEVMQMGEEIRALVLGKGTSDQIAEAAREAGMTSLRDDGLAKARAGVTSVAEVLRVLGS